MRSKVTFQIISKLPSQINTRPNTTQITKKNEDTEIPPSGFWNTKSNQRSFFDTLGKQIGIKQMEDWYHELNAKLIQDHGGKQLLKIFNGSPIAAIQASYPEHQWIPWKFSKVPQGYWSQLPNIIAFMSEMEKVFGIQQPEDWYRVSTKLFKEKGGSLLASYNNSMMKLMQVVYPHVDWKPWLFSAVSPHHWKDISHIMEYVAWFKKKMKIAKKDDWYRITAKDFHANGGGGMLSSIYHNSVYELLLTIYPNEGWQPWKFTQAPKHFFDSDENLKNYINWVEKELGLTCLADWYHVSAKDITKHFHGGTLLNKFGGLGAVLAHCYPEYDWNLSFFERGVYAKPSKAQIRLHQAVREIFPSEDIHVDYKHPQLDNKQELDMFLPRLKLAFEYQGEQHYTNHYLYRNLNVAQGRDTVKQSACHRLGIVLITIPYWWDRSVSSLKATVHKIFPELDVGDVVGEPIPVQSNKT